MSHLDDNNDELTRELRNRSEDVGGHPIDFDSVRRTAQGIQRRRRIVGGIAAAAVLAVAVPAGVAASNNLNLGQEPAGQPTTAVSVTTQSLSTEPTETTATQPTATEPTATEPTETTSSSASPDPSAGKTVDLTTASAVRGADPVITYLDEQMLIVPGGAPVDLGADYFEIAPHRGGWVALGSDNNGNLRLFFLAADGMVQDYAATTGESLAINAAGDYVAYALQNGVVKLAPTSDVGEAYTFNLDAPGPVTPVAVGPVSTRYAEPTGVIFYNTEGRDPRAWGADLHGIVDTVPPFTRIAGFAPDGALAGQISSSDTGGTCSQVSNPDRSKRWETCDFSLDRFSPDGRYVLARSAYFDGLGDSQVTILDAQTGDVVVSYQRPRNSPLFVRGIAWEDGSHALATVYEDGAWRILRLDLDGNIEAASSAAVTADEVSSPFRFGTTP